MQRYFPYFGVIAALVVMAGIASQSGVTQVEVVPSGLRPPATTTTVTALPSTTTPKAVKEVAASTTKLAPPSPPPSNSALVNAASALKKALVNILCYAPSTSGVRSTSGGGVIVSSKGYILTNAHVAQYFLLADRGISCTIRTGSPAADAYKAELAYISPVWLRDNAGEIVDPNPTGTGEHDVAVLAITKTLAATAAPYAYVPLSRAAPKVDEPVAIASYGAQFLSATQIENTLYPTVVLGSIKRLYTFATDTPDVIALGGSVASQAGSSGGGAVNAQGALVGTITTSHIEGTLQDRTLNAFTVNYARAEYQHETGQSLDTLLSAAPALAVQAFAANVAPLRQLLENAIDRR